MLGFSILIRYSISHNKPNISNNEALQGSMDRESESEFRECGPCCCCFSYFVIQL